MRCFLFVVARLPVPCAREGTRNFEKSKNNLVKGFFRPYNVSGVLASGSLGKLKVAIFDVVWLFFECFLDIQCLFKSNGLKEVWGSERV